MFYFAMGEAWSREDLLGWYGGTSAGGFHWWTRWLGKRGMNKVVRGSGWAR